MKWDYYVFQTIALLNIYRNPQNNVQSADGLTCKSLNFAQISNLVALILNMPFFVILGAITDMEMQEHYDEFFEVTYSIFTIVLCALLHFFQ